MRFDLEEGQTKKPKVDMTPTADSVRQRESHAERADKAATAEMATVLEDDPQKQEALRYGVLTGQDKEKRQELEAADAEDKKQRTATALQQEGFTPQEIGGAMAEEQFTGDTVVGAALIRANQDGITVSDGKARVLEEVSESTKQSKANTYADEEGKDLIGLEDATTYGMQRRWREILTQYAESDDLSVMDWGLVGNLAYAAVPYVQQIATASAGSAAVGNLDGVEYIMGGQGIEEIQRRFDKADPIEQEIVARAFIKALEGGGAGVSDLQMYGTLMEVAEADYNDGTVNWSLVFEDAVSVWDIALSLSSGIKAGVRVARSGVIKRASQAILGSGSTSYRVMSQFDEYAELAADSLKLDLSDPARAAKNGTNQVEIIESTLPGAGARTETHIPPADLPERPKYVPRFRDENLDDLTQDAVDVLADNMGGRLNVSRSVIGEYDEATESFQFFAVVGRESGRGYDTIDEAVENARLAFGEGEPINIIGWDYLDGKAKTLDEVQEMIKAGEPAERFGYLAEVETRLAVRPEGVGAFDEADFNGGFLGFMRNGWLSSASAKIGEPIRRMTTLSVDREAAVLQDFAEKLSPYSKLKRRERARVDDMLLRGEKEGKVYTLDELSTIVLNGKPLTTKEIEAYMAYRRYAEQAYREADTALRKKMFEAGVKVFTNEDTGRVYAATPMSFNSLPNKKIRVLDADTGEVIEVSPSQIKVLRDQSESNGLILGKLYKTGTDRIQNGAEYVIAGGRAFGGNTRVLPLPETGVLKNIPGYIPRQYTANYFISRKLSNGEIRTVAAANTEREARAFAEKLFKRKVERAKKKGEVPPRSVDDLFSIDSALQEGVDRASRHDDLFEVQNLMFYQDRAPRTLTNVGQGPIVNDPYEALMRNVQTLASKVGTGRVIEVLENKFMKRYKHVIKGEVNGMPRSHGDFIEGRLTGRMQEDRRAAKALFDQIQLIKFAPTGMQEAWYNSVRAIAEGFDVGIASKIPYSDSAARTFYELAKSQRLTPWALYKSAAFTTQILLAPMRQAYIQSHQALFLTGIDPTILPRSFLWDGFYLSSQFLEDTRIASGAPKWKRAMSKAISEVTGTTFNQKEADLLAKNFKESGIPSLRAQIQLEDNLMFDWPVFRAMGEIGYALGERHNLAATYAFAYRKYLKDTGKTWKALTPDDWDEIAFKAREYALSMTRADAFKYQQGALSATTQYLAIRHKALQAFFGSKAFTPAEKARMGVTQAILFGAEGYGLGHAVNLLVDELGYAYGGTGLEPETEKNLVKAGIYDTVMNAFVGAILRDAYRDEVGDPNIEFSKSMSALGDMDSMVVAALQTWDGARPFDLAKFLVGPGYATQTNMFTMFRRINIMRQRPDLDTLDKAANYALEVGKLSSSVSNVTKAVIGSNINYIVDKYGSPIVKAHKGELFVKGLLGFSTVGESEYYWRKFVENNRDEAVQTIARDFASMILANLGDDEALQGIYYVMQVEGGNDPVLQAEIDRATQRYLQEMYVLGGQTTLKTKVQQMAIENERLYNSVLNSQEVLENEKLRAIRDDLINLREGIESMYEENDE